MTERHNSTKLFHEKLSMLNDNLIKFLQKQHAKKPYADLVCLFVFWIIFNY